MTLDQFYTKIDAKLAEEAGSSDFWTETEIKQWSNDLYRETARELKCIKYRDITTVSVAETQRYAIPLTGAAAESIIRLLDVTYKGITVNPTTIKDLNNNVYNWRNQGSSSSPWCWFFDRGYENQSISFFPKNSTASDEIGFEFALIPNELGDSDSFKNPMHDGLILMDGILAICLAKAGGGRDLDRSDYYWSQFVSKASGLRSDITPVTHAFKSVEESGLSRIASPRLPSNYPPYSFD